MLDMDNIVDIWLYLQMFYGEDNIYKNMFFAFKKEESGYKMYLVPWDVDLTWGNIYTDNEEMLYTVYAPERVRKYLQWPFADRLLSLNAGDIRKKAADRWEELRKGILSDTNMQRLLEQCIHLVQDSGAFARDAARWPESSHDGDYDSMRLFMKGRMAFMDQLIQNQAIRN